MGILAPHSNRLSYRVLPTGAGLKLAVLSESQWSWSTLAGFPQSVAPRFGYLSSVDALLGWTALLFLR